ncbi:MAG: TonB-dependent siderophore receptor [Cyanobacteria bacterium J06631_9]
MRKWLQRCVWAIAAIAGGQFFLMEGALANQLTNRLTNPLANPLANRLSASEEATAVQFISQETAESIQITAIQLTPTDSGIEIVLISDFGAQVGTELQPQTRTTGNALIVEIPDALLSLPEDEELLIFNPVEGIAVLQAVNTAEQTVQLSITGTEALPTVQISSEDSRLQLAVTLGNPATASEEDDSLQLVVTGEQDADYFVPNASTATRTDTPIVDIPQSIQVIPRELLEDQQVTRLDEALDNVSGVNFSSTDAGRGLQFSIRGFDNAPILRNGFRQIGPRQGSSRRSFPEIANIEQIEVIKGPAAVLYGEVEPGGLINLVTKRPLPEPFYQLQAEVGSRGFFRPSLDFSGPLTSDNRVGYRLNAVYQTNEEIQDYSTNINRFFVSPVLSWQISDRTDLAIEFEYLDDERPVFYGLPAFGEGIADIPQTQISNEPDDVITQNYLNIGYDLEHRFSEQWRLGNGFRYVRENSALEGAIPIALNEETGVLLRNWSLQDTETELFALQTNVVGEFSTGSVEHELLFGADIDRTNLDGFTTGDVFTPLPLDIFNPVYGAVPRPGDFEALPLILDESVTTDRLGLYVQDRISFTDNFSLLAGLRYDTVRQHRTGRATLFNPEGTDETQNDDAFSPRIGIVYQPTEAVSLYANYSRSFSPNTGSDFEGNAFEPEEGDGYEVGVKTELLDGALAATLSYFNITKRNVVTADPEVLGASVVTGEQQSRGLELDVIGEISPGWNVVASYAFIDAEITADNTFEVGNQLISVPRNSASLWSTYEIRSGDFEGLGFGLGFNFVGERKGDLVNSFELDSYFTTNAAVFYERDNWRTALNFRNLFDTDYIVGSVNNRFRSNEPGEPFTVIGTVSVEF